MEPVAATPITPEMLGLIGQGPVHLLAMFAGMAVAQLFMALLPAVAFLAMLGISS